MEIASGMSYLSHSKIIHRELNTLNIFISKNGNNFTPKIANSGFRFILFCKIIIHIKFLIVELQKDIIPQRINLNL
jgi:serine/threonine protein kinase